MACGLVEDGMDTVDTVSWVYAKGKVKEMWRKCEGNEKDGGKWLGDSMGKVMRTEEIHRLI